MRFDIALSGSDDRGNGAFNQNVLNVPAVGTVTTDGDGNLTIETVGSFPVAVNRTGQATTNFRLRLSAPATDTGGDTAQPRITAQYPSACAYTFGTARFADSADLANGLIPISFPEADCVSVIEDGNALVSDAAGGIENPPPSPLGFRQVPARVTSFPLDANPSITFSEPMDPSTLDGNILLTDSSGAPIEVRLRAEGSSVVIDPAAPLNADTEYTITVANSVTDLVGNGLQGSYPDVTFTTEAMVRGDDSLIQQNAPFISALIPGLPCALKDGDFVTGGNMAGRCTGDAPLPDDLVVPPLPLPGTEAITYEASPRIDYPVFENPANIAIQAEFSKPVQASTIVAADGCLIGGDGQNANTIPNATIAVQVMDDSGQCTGVAEGDVLLRVPGSNVTRGFSFPPVDGFTEGQRYWLVMCGSEDVNADDPGPSDCTSGATIIGQDGYELNTNPLMSTGTSNGGVAGCYSSSSCLTIADSTPELGIIDNRGAGGPDLIMPFDAAPPTSDFYTIALALPFSDTNGNGFVDREPREGDNRFSILDPDDDKLIDTSLGEERLQPANSVILQDALSGNVDGSIFGSLRGPAYLSGGLPTVIREATNDCDAIQAVKQENTTPDDPTDDIPIVTSGVPDECIPVDILPGGFTSIASSAGISNVSTGRVILRYPFARDAQGDSTGKPQRGYIVPECQGTFRTLTTPTHPDTSEIHEEPYHYAPCFVADFRLTVQAPDFSLNDPSEVGLPEAGRAIGQQDIKVQVFGPVAFERNGRLVISTRNTNTFDVIATVPLGASILPAQKITYPGRQRLQLVTPPVHGGPLQAFEVP